MSKSDLDLPEGKEDVTLPINALEPKAFTRKLSNGETQIWDLEGPNKETWVDEKGKKVPSSNFVFVAPDTLKIKKVTKEDAGFYDYYTKLNPAEVDIPPSGVQLNVG
ncbi:unnamed protein product [Caenorhabditis nigoni]